MRNIETRHINFYRMPERIYLDLVLELDHVTAWVFTLQGLVGTYFCAVIFEQFIQFVIKISTLTGRKVDVSSNSASQTNEYRGNNLQVLQFVQSLLISNLGANGRLLAFLYRAIHRCHRSGVEPWTWISGTPSTSVNKLFSRCDHKLRLSQFSDTAYAPNLSDEINC